MLKVYTRSVLIFVVMTMACSDRIDPLAPGSLTGDFAVGIKGLVPIAIGNRWTYLVTTYDTTGAETRRYSYTMVVTDTVTADTSRIPLRGGVRQSMTPTALRWFSFRGDGGATTLWQVDTVEQLRFRPADDSRFYEQTAFNFRAAVHDTSAAVFVRSEMTIWESSDTATTADSVRTVLTEKADSLRTTLGSAPVFRYRQRYDARSVFTEFAFKPGFGLVLVERFAVLPGGGTVCVRRDQVTSYFLQPSR